MADQTVIRTDFTADMRDAFIALLREYEASLNISLCFQNYDAELARFPEGYQPPDGALIFATGEGGNDLLGMAAVRRLDAARCEMKRLYVRPVARGQGLGRRLIDECLRQAKSAGYGAMRLDTLESMTAARRLYADYGFREIGNYNDSPDENHQHFFELVL